MNGKPETSLPPETMSPWIQRADGEYYCRNCGCLQGEGHHPTCIEIAPLPSKKIAHELFDACNAFKEDSKQWQRIAVAIQAAEEEIERLTRELGTEKSGHLLTQGERNWALQERDRLRAALEEITWHPKRAYEIAQQALSVS